MMNICEQSISRTVGAWLIKLAAVGMSLVFYSHALAEDDVILEEIAVPDRIDGTSTKDINERSEFETKDQVAKQYVAIVVEITKTGTTPIDASLVRGPTTIANNSVKDLRVSAMQSTRVVSAYSMPDPRFVRRERGVTGRMEPWIELDSATAVVYVPLSPMIDQVEINPEPGRSPTVSSGGSFDPRQWATGACDGHDPNLYPDCSDVIALGLTPLP